MYMSGLALISHPHQALVNPNIPSLNKQNQMNIEQIKAAKARLEAAKKSMKQIESNGFTGSNSMEFKGVIIGVENRAGYQQCFAIDETGKEWTLLNKTPENPEIAASDTERTITIANGRKNKEAIWIVKAA